MSKNRFNGRVENKTTNSVPHAPKKETGAPDKKNYEPEYSQDQIDLAEFLELQVKEFLDTQKNVSTMSYEDRRAAENALFSTPNYPTVFTFCPNYNAYMVYRSVRVDRNTHLLTRASCTMILIDQETAEPVYLVDAFINANGGTITVVPQGDKGPILRDTYRITLKRD